MQLVCMERTLPEHRLAEINKKNGPGADGGLGANTGWFQTTCASILAP